MSKRKTEYHMRGEISLRWKLAITLLSISFIISFSYNIYQSNTYTAQTVISLQSNLNYVQQELNKNMSLVDSLQQQLKETNTTINSLQKQVNDLNQQLSKLLPIEVRVHGTAVKTGWFNTAKSIVFIARGITYSVPIRDGAYQIFLPTNYAYQVSIEYEGWFWSRGSCTPSQKILNLEANQKSDFPANWEC